MDGKVRCKNEPTTERNLPNLRRNETNPEKKKQSINIETSKEKKVDDAGNEREYYNRELNNTEVKEDQDP